MEMGLAAPVRAYTYCIAKQALVCTLAPTLVMLITAQTQVASAPLRRDQGHKYCTTLHDTGGPGTENRDWVRSGRIRLLSTRSVPRAGLICCQSAETADVINACFTCRKSLGASVVLHAPE